MEIDYEFANNMISKIVMQLTSESSESDFNSSDSFEKGSIKKKTRKRKRNFKFDIESIMGSFDIDDQGHL